MRALADDKEPRRCGMIEPTANAAVHILAIVAISVAAWSTEWVEIDSTNCRRGLFQECCPLPPPHGPRVCDGIEGVSDRWAVVQWVVPASMVVCLVVVLMDLRQRQGFVLCGTDDCSACLGLGRVIGAMTVVALAGVGCFTLLIEIHEMGYDAAWAFWLYLSATGLMLMSLVCSTMFRSLLCRDVDFSRPVYVPLPQLLQPIYGEPE